MPETYTYTWSATDRSGQTVIREIEAQTSEEAKTRLLADGYSNLVLKEDEIMNVVQAGFEKGKTFLGEEIKVTAAGRVQEQDNPLTVWGLLKRGLGQLKIIFLILVLYAGFQIYRGSYVSGSLAIVAICLLVAFVICVSLPSIYFRKLVEAEDWYRWKEVLSLINTLEFIGRFSIVKVPATDLTRRRAKAFVGMGDLQKGLDEYKRCLGRPDCPVWLYKAFVAGLYTVAKQYDKAIEYNLAAIAEKPRSTGWADLAYRYARYKRDPVKAREAMAEAEKSEIPDAAKSFRSRCRGVIAYLEGDFATAKSELENAISSVENMKWRPYNDGHLAIARAYLCCVLAKQGDLSAAKKNFEMANKYLVATKEGELIAECRKLIGDV